jgi:hypothetical protein
VLHSKFSGTLLRPAIESLLTLIYSEEDKLHGIVNNAGIMAVANEISKDGYEVQWQVRSSFSILMLS